MKLNRREFLAIPPLMAAWPKGAAAQAAGSRPIPEPHFPSRLYQFVWRNWELARIARMAAVLGTDAETVRALGADLGLWPKLDPTPDQERRIYITVIRQNWHLLPSRQLIQLLEWDAKRFEFTLKEDDFLSHKLGPKPECLELRFAPPTDAERERAGKIAPIAREIWKPVEGSGERLFQFVKELSDPVPGIAPTRAAAAGEVDLSREWGVATYPDARAGAASRLSGFLSTAGGAKKPSKEITLAIDAGCSDAFQISVEDASIDLKARDEFALHQAVTALMDEFAENGRLFLAKGTRKHEVAWSPRYLYSYFALYGDPLLEKDVDPFPEAYLERLARAGIDGVWIQAVLNTLAPSKHFPEFGTGWEARLRNLSELVRRARSFGIKIYLYLNEPRAMPEEFFKDRPGMKGTSAFGLHAMCTSVPAVREWIQESLAHIVKHVPDLGGFFTITMSENHTNCFSHGGTWGKAAPEAKGCPRCSTRTGWEVIAELIRAFRQGAGSAELIVWDWGWGEALADRLIPLLPRHVKFMSISEWDQPVERGGVKTKVGEYSISVPGPGPRAARHWEIARKAGIPTLAKVQFNNTWELSAVPYIPVPPLVLEHCEKLEAAGISGIMASWTLGGYPSPNLEVAKAFYARPRKGRDAILHAAAARRYGRDAAAQVVEGWKKLSEAFREFPYGVSIYVIPVQHGPANLLRLEPTGVRPSMILFPQDDVRRWCGVYPPEVVQRQFAKMAAMWKEGLTPLRAALEKAPGALQAAARRDLAVAETCGRHFASVAHQVEFYLLRERPGREKLARMREIVEAEIALARAQFADARSHSEIGYEASNHYYYTPLDLIEKVLNGRRVLDELAR